MMTQHELSKEYLYKLTNTLHEHADTNESNSDLYKSTCEKFKNFWTVTARFAVLHTVRPGIFCNDGTKVVVNAGPGWRGTIQKDYVNAEEYKSFNYTETNTELRRSLTINLHDVIVLLTFHGGIDYDKSTSESTTWQKSMLVSVDQESLNTTAENCQFFRELLNEQFDR